MRIENFFGLPRLTARNDVINVRWRAGEAEASIREKRLEKRDKGIILAYEKSVL